MAESSPVWFHDAVSALAYSLAEFDNQNKPLQPPYNDLTRFVLEQHSRMPDYLRFGITAATLGLHASSFFTHGKFFHHLPPEIRKRKITAWRNAKIGFQRDLIRYFESLATLSLYSREACQPISPATFVSGRNVIDHPENEMSAEIVVVGSGPGGAITACLLAEAGRDVLLVEEGAFYSLESCAPFSQIEMIQKYRNGGQTVALGRNNIAYVEGRCVGGGSEINSALYHRTPPEILARWRTEFQVEGLSELEMQPHFETCERDVAVSPLPFPAPAASLKLHEGARRLGWKSIEVPRWFRYDSASEKSQNGTRQSMTETYVPRFLHAGGKLLSRCRVSYFRQEGGKWNLNATHASRKTIRIQAENVFLCAGAIQTPCLLRYSGITRNVGDALQMHPTVKIVARFPEPVSPADMGVPVHQVKEFSPRLGFGCSISSPPYLALALLDHPQTTRTVADDWTHLAIYYAMITSEGRGSVRRLPGCADPLVRYTLTEKDRRHIADGLKKLTQILFEAGATALYPSLAHGPALLCREDSAILPDLMPNGMANLMTIHLFSSCAMGENRDRCAADSFGRVHDLKNLFVNDASLLCTAPGVNPQGSIMAIARRNALHFLGKI